MIEQMFGVLQLARGLGLAAEAHPHLLVAREVRVEHLEHERPLELRVLGAVDVRHAAAADAAQHAVAVPGRAAQRRDLGVGRLGGHAGELGKGVRAAAAFGGHRAVPGAALGTEQVSLRTACARNRRAATGR
jgi:hypothetical protein